MREKLQELLFVVLIASASVWRDDDLDVLVRFAAFRALLIVAIVDDDDFVLFRFASCARWLVAAARSSSGGCWRWRSWRSCGDQVLDDIVVVSEGLSLRA